VEPGAAGTTANRGNTPFGGIVGTEARGNIAPPESADPPAAGRGGFDASIGAGTETAGDGGFLFADLPPGNYILAVRMEHYVSQEYGQRAVRGRGRPISIGPGERRDNLDFHLTKLGVIAGTVVDENGAPLVGAEVQALSYSPNPGGRILAAVGDPRKTDDLGRYRLDDLQPDAYLVVARAVERPSIPAGPRGGPRGGVGARGGAVGAGPAGQGRGGPAGPGGRGGGVAGRGNASQAVPSPFPQVFVPVFHPDAPHPAQAGAVKVPAGGEVRGIDFRIRPTPSAELTGTVLPLPDAPAGKTGEPVGAEVSLVPVGYAGSLLPGMHMLLGDVLSRLHEPRSVMAEDNGSFKFTGVVPGAYRIVAVRGRGDDRVAAIQDVDIRPASTQSVTLALVRGIDIRGQVYAEGQAPPGFQIQRLDVQLSIYPDLYFVSGLSNIAAKVGADGAFVLRNAVPNARYRIAVGGLVRDQTVGYVNAARYGDGDPFDPPIVPKDREALLQVQIGFAPGRVEAVVLDRGKPRQGVPTVLIPQIRNRYEFYRELNSDAEGRVAFADVPPGDYKLFAWEDAERGRWFDPQFLQQYEERGRLIHVEKAGTSTHVVEIIGAEGGELQ
jgi:hypothetical protein